MPGPEQHFCSSRANISRSTCDENVHKPPKRIERC
jgi:hypothetical protein